MLMNSGGLKSQVSMRVVTGSILIMAVMAVTVVIGAANGGDGTIASQGLYVLDSNDGAATGQVILVDTSNGKTISAYSAGFHADMALSPDGTRLYIASTRGSDGRSARSLLEIYDTGSHALIGAVENPEAFQSTMPIYGSSMAISSSGRYIYVMKQHITRVVNEEYVTAFDTLENRFLKAHASLDNECNFIMLPTAADLTLDVACRNSANLREFTLGDTAEPAKDILLPIGTTERRKKWGAVFLQPGGQQVAFVSASGEAFALDRVSAAVHHLGTTSESGPWIQRGLMPKSRNAVYFSTARAQRPFPNTQDTIVAADPVTLALRGTISATDPFFSIELSRDGSSLYTIDPEKASITVVDLASFREVRRFGPIGHTPTIAIAAP